MKHNETQLVQFFTKASAKQLKGRIDTPKLTFHQTWMKDLIPHGNLEEPFWVSMGDGQVGLNQVAMIEWGGGVG